MKCQDESRVGNGEEGNVPGWDWIAGDGMAIGGGSVSRLWSPQGHGVRLSSGAVDRRPSHTPSAILRRGCSDGVQGGRGRPQSRTLRVGRGLAGGGLAVVHPDRKGWSPVPRPRQIHPDPSGLKSTSCMRPGRSIGKPTASTTRRSVHLAISGYNSPLLTGHRPGAFIPTSGNCGTGSGPNPNPIEVCNG